MEKYNSNLTYSYVFGAFGTITLLECKPDVCKGILVDPSFKDNEAMNKIYEICNKNHIPVTIDLKTIDKIRDKKNIYVIGVFEKYKSELDNNKHLVLYKINDVGVIGTIIRSMQGFNFNNLALVDCNVDMYHEHLVRSTMGAFFRCNVKEYKDLDSYIKEYPNLNLYSITNKGNDINTINKDENISLIFSKENIENNKIKDILFSKDIPLENIVNIVLFKLYN